MRRPIEVPGRTRAFAASNGAGWSRICEFLQTPPAGCSRKGRKAKCQIRAIREAHEGSEKRDAARVPRRFCEFFKVNARMAGLFPPVLEYPGVPSPGAGRRARTRRCRCHPAGSMSPTICPTRISCMVHTPPPAPEDITRMVTNETVQRLGGCAPLAPEHQMRQVGSAKGPLLGG